MRPDAKTRLMNSVSAVTESGCWIWLGSLNRHGYGKFWFNSRDDTAHRVSYKLFRGDIPSDRGVLHHCDVRCCVNPNHLFLGLPGDNSRDMVSKDRQAKGVRNGNSKLTKDQVMEVKSSSEKSQTLADRFGVSHATIWWIRKGATWKHIGETV